MRNIRQSYTTDFSNPLLIWKSLYRSYFFSHAVAIFRHPTVHRKSGGGQTKCLKYIPEQVRVVKDNLFTPPVIFDIIQQASGASAHEMYQVFNMGCRMEIYSTERHAASVIQAANHYGVEARIIGRVEAAERKELVIQTKDEALKF